MLDEEGEEVSFRAEGQTWNQYLPVSLHNNIDLYFNATITSSSTML